MLLFFPRDVLDEIWVLIESGSDGFPSSLQLNFICSLRANGKESLYIFWSMTHDQDGLSCSYMVNTFANFLLQNHWADWYIASGFTLTSLRAR